jgi:hypothetical protein
LNAAVEPRERNQDVLKGKGDTTMKTFVRLMTGAMMTAGLVMGIAHGASAQSQEPTGTELIVHQRLCGENYQGGDPFTECHDYLVGDSYEFAIEGPVNLSGALTDAATGNVTFGGLIAGTYHLYGGVPGEFVNKEFYCSDQNTGEAVSVTAGTIGVNVEVPDGASVVCDVYEYPIDMSGNDDKPAPQPEPTKPSTGGPAVTNLPNTGAGTGASTDAAWLLIPAAMGAAGLGLTVRRRVLR